MSFMNNLMSMAFILFCLSLSVIADDSIRIKSISKSGRTIIIENGSIKGINAGEIGAFFLEEGNLAKPDLTFISEAKCIQAGANYSIWFLDSSISLGDLEGGSIQLATKASILKGHVSTKLKSKIIYNETQSIRSFNGKQAYPIWLSERFIEGQKLNNNDDDREDFEVADEQDSQNKSASGDGIEVVEDDLPLESMDENLEIDEKPEMQGDRYLEEFDRYVNIKLLKRKTKTQLIDEKHKELERAEVLNLSKGSYGKVEKFKAGLIDLYEDVQTNTADMIEDRNNFNNSYNEFASVNKDIDKNLSEKRRNRAKYNDPLWPSGLSDLELRRYFLSHGLDEFEDRKNLILKNYPGNEVIIRFFYGLTRNTTDIDPNYQATNKSIYFGYEWHLMQVDPYFKFLGLEIGIESTNGNYEVGVGQNAFSYEIGGRMMLNYYINQLPSAVDKLCWYAGIGGKLGNAKISSVNLSQDYNYFQVTLPSIQFGVKYRFRAGDEIDQLPKLGMGWNLSVIGDTSSFYNSREMFDDIKPNFHSADVKFVTGLAIFF